MLPPVYATGYILGPRSALLSARGLRYLVGQIGYPFSELGQPVHDVRVGGEAHQVAQPGLDAAPHETLDTVVDQIATEVAHHLQRLLDPEPGQLGARHRNHTIQAHKAGLSENEEGALGGLHENQASQEQHRQ